MVMARFVESLITVALFAPLVILAWTFPKAYRIVATCLVGASTLFLVAYQSYYEGAERMYIRAMEASNYYQKPLPRYAEPRAIDPDYELHAYHTESFTVLSDTAFSARRHTLEFWADVLPAKIDSEFIHVAPLNRYVVLFTYILLCSMLWTFTYVHRLKRSKTAQQS